MAQEPDNTDGSSSNEFGGINVVNPGDFDGNEPAENTDAGTTDAGNNSVSGTGERKRRKRRTREEIERDGGTSRAKETSGTRTTQTQVKANIETTTAVLFSIHQMLASMMQEPEILITEDQAKALAVAVAHVQSFYPNKANAKALAWANLGMIAGAIYGPKVVKILQKQKSNNQGNPPPVPRNVPPFGNVHGFPVA